MALAYIFRHWEVALFVPKVFKDRLCVAWHFVYFSAHLNRVGLELSLQAVAFYAVCRALNCEWRWAFVGGLVFAFASYSFARQMHHLQVLYYWHIPACMLVVCWLFSSEGIR